MLTEARNADSLHHHLWQGFVFVERWPFLHFGSGLGLALLNVHPGSVIGPPPVSHVTQAVGGSDSFAVGDMRTIVYAWDATHLYMSINGAPFTTASRAGGVPDLSAGSTFDVGSLNGANQADSDVLWAVAGTGTLSSSDLATINHNGNTDPSSPSGLPGHSTFLWQANTAAATVWDTGQLQTDVTGYSYDQAGRLATVTLPDGSSRRYCYDLDSNRTAIYGSSTAGCTDSNPLSSYTYDPSTTPGVDELTKIVAGSQQTNFGYTADGQVNAKGSSTLTWDGWGRMSGGTFNGNTVTYGFDPTGFTRQRVSQGKTTRYLLNGLFETDAAGSITTSYIDGPTGDLASYNGAPGNGSIATFEYYSGHGDLAAESDATGARTNAMSYDPFGAPNQSAPANSASHRFTGAWNKQYDSSTSLIQMGIRPYDPTLGRFLSVDPVDGGSLNNYDYAGQDPVNNYDLAGMWTCWKRAGCGAAVWSPLSTLWKMFTGHLDEAGAYQKAYEEAQRMDRWIRAEDHLTEMKGKLPSEAGKPMPPESGPGNSVEIPPRMIGPAGIDDASGKPNRAAAGQPQHSAAARSRSRNSLD